MIIKRYLYLPRPVGLAFLLCTLAISACKPAEKPLAQQSASQLESVAGTESKALAPKPPPFDPATCKEGDKKYVYWAARDQVFRFKYDPKEPLYPLPESQAVGTTLDAKKEVPPAPVPSEPEGCYGNPLRAFSVPYMKTFDAALFRKLMGRDLGSVEGGYFAGSHGRYRKSADRLFLESTNCWFRDSGIEECLLNNAVGKQKEDYTVTHAFKIGKQLLPKHNEVTDIYFSVWNDAAADVDHGMNGKAVVSSFDLYGGVRFENSIRIFPNEVDLLVSYYSGLIRYVLDGHVSDYRWTRNETN